MKDHQPEQEAKTLAAVCGLYCGACTLYIATQEDPTRLKVLAKQFGLPEEAMKCNGCRSSVRGPYCSTMCKMFDCAKEHGVDFCSECSDYPCNDLKQFQSQAPHRNELWEDLDQIKDAGCMAWLSEVVQKYTCPSCSTINSAYDITCRKCGNTPSCDYVARHKDSIEVAIKARES